MIQLLVGLWSLGTPQQLVGGVLSEECLSPSVHSRVRIALSSVSNRRRAISVRSFAIRTRVELLLFYTFDSTNSGISEKSSTMLPSGRNLSTRTPTRKRGTARLLPPFWWWDPGGHIGISRRLLSGGTRPQRRGTMGSTDSTGVRRDGLFLQGKEC